MKRPRLLLADEDTLVLEGLKKLLDEEFDVVGMVGDGRALLTEAQALLPDVILLSISMPLLNGIEAACHLQKNLPQIKLIVVTMHEDQEHVEAALRAGVSGYLLKRSAPAELTLAIREALTGKRYITPQIATDMLHAWLERPKTETPDQLPQKLLTHRQREVLQLIAEGRADKEIANILNTSVKTVEFHKSGIRRLLNLKTRAELTQYAITEGIILP